jgi:hypothetical protein
MLGNIEAVKIGIFPFGEEEKELVLNGTRGTRIVL